MNALTTRSAEETTLKLHNQDLNASVFDSSFNIMTLDRSSTCFRFIIGNFLRRYNRKLFHEDPVAAKVLYYVDADYTGDDKIKELYDYVILGAIYSLNIQRFDVSRVHGFLSPLQDETYTVLCYLRTKCSNPEYEVVLVKDADGLCSRMDLTTFRKMFVFRYDIPVNGAQCVEALAAHFERKKMFWDPVRNPFNKSETGNIYAYQWFSTYYLCSVLICTLPYMHIYVLM